MPPLDVRKPRLKEVEQPALLEMPREILQVPDDTLPPIQLEAISQDEPTLMTSQTERPVRGQIVKTRAKRVRMAPPTKPSKLTISETDYRLLEKCRKQKPPKAQKPVFLGPPSAKADLAVEFGVVRDTILDSAVKTLSKPLSTQSHNKHDEKLLKTVQNLGFYKAFQLGSKRSKYIDGHPIGFLVNALFEEFEKVDEVNEVVMEEITIMFNPEQSARIKDESLDKFVTVVEEYFSALDDFMGAYDDFVDKYSQPKYVKAHVDGDVVKAAKAIEIRRKTLQLHVCKLMRIIREFDPTVVDRDAWTVSTLCTKIFAKDEEAKRAFEAKQQSMIGRWWKKTTKLVSQVRDFGAKAMQTWQKMQNYRVVQWAVAVSERSTMLWILGHYVYQVVKVAAVRCKGGCTGWDILFALAAGACNSLQDPITLGKVVTQVSNLVMKVPPLSVLSGRLTKLAAGVTGDTVAFLAPVYLNTQIKSFLGMILKFMCGALVFANQVGLRTLSIASGNAQNLLKELQEAPTVVQGVKNWMYTLSEDVYDAVVDEGDFLYEVLPANVRKPLDALASVIMSAYGGGYKALMDFIMDPVGTMKTFFVGSTKAATAAITKGIKNKVKSWSSWIGFTTPPAEVATNVAKIAKVAEVEGVDPTMLQQWSLRAGELYTKTKDSVTPYVNRIYAWYGEYTTAVVDKFSVMMETANLYLAWFYWVTAIIERTREFFGGDTAEQRKIKQLQAALEAAQAGEKRMAIYARINYTVNERRALMRKLRGRSVSESDHMRDVIEDEFQDLRRVGVKLGVSNTVEKIIDQLSNMEKGPAYDNWNELTLAQQRQVYTDLQGVAYNYSSGLKRRAQGTAVA